MLLGLKNSYKRENTGNKISMGGSMINQGTSVDDGSSKVPRGHSPICRCGTTPCRFLGFLKLLALIRSGLVDDRNIYCKAFVDSIQETYLGFHRTLSTGSFPVFIYLSVMTRRNVNGLAG